MKEVFPVLGFDVGGTKIAVCLADSAGTVLGSARIGTKDRHPDQVLPEIVSAGMDLLDQAGIKSHQLHAIGIGAPGPIDIPKGLMLSSPNMKSWNNVPIRDYLHENFGVPVAFDNDANAGALAEWIFGAGKGCRDMLYLTMSTGIGGGIIANGHLVQGTSGLAGEVGHVILDITGPKCNCGLTGCYEAFCGGRAIAQRIQRELAGQTDHPIVHHAGGKLEDVDLVALEKAVRDGDSYANTLWAEMCLRNSQAIGIFINIFNPQKIVLGTLAWAAGDLFMKPVLKELPRFCWPETLRDCDVVPSALKRKIGELSGACIALNELYERGEWLPSWLKK